MGNGNVANERLMTQEAFVIERTLNGIVVRPHSGWWTDDRSRPFGVSEVRVFNDLKDFERWFAQWFPVESKD